MFIVVDERVSVTDQYVAGFGQEGVAARAFPTDGFEIWLNDAKSQDLDTIEGVVLGDCTDRAGYAATIRALSHAPIIALNETRSLEQPSPSSPPASTMWCASPSMSARSSPAPMRSAAA